MNNRKGVSLPKVIKSQYAGKVSDYLVSYIDSRWHQRQIDESNGDCVGKTEITSENSGAMMYDDIN